MHKTLKFNQNEIDWAFDLNVHAINRDTRIFENCSYATGLIVELWENTDENDVSNALGERLRSGQDYDFALYNDSHELVGFAHYEEPEDKPEEKVKMVKRVYRFHAHSWTDVIIEVPANMDDDEAMEVASDKYNDGDYEYDAEDFENTDVEEVTDYYKEDKIYPFDK